ncbi:hypothetical protein ACFQW6_13010 [Nocardioides sp. GCM10028917]|uniref:hypothetical protein n=1 Tax=Nocardioides sp. GCM10028917 TaxID=3273408 RepID=UPI00361DFE01
MLVSNFIVDRARSPLGERFTDFFALITNLHDEPIKFLVGAHVHIDAETKDRLGRANVPRASLVVAGTEMGPVQLGSAKSATRAWWMLRAPAGGTTMVHFQRRENPEHAGGVEYRNVPVTGYVTLRVPPVSREGKLLRLWPQASGPVPVLLSAWTRTTREPTMVQISDPHGVSYQHTTEGEDTSSTEVPLANGAAYAEVDAESVIVGDIEDALQEIDAKLTSAHGSEEHWFALLDEHQRVPALVTLLSAVQNVSEADLAKLNNVLAEEGSLLRLHHPDR